MKFQKTNQAHKQKQKTPYTRGRQYRLLGFWPLGQNPVGANNKDSWLRADHIQLTFMP